ncbi:MAG: carboxypeptidase-like regulatory domain-containing protein [Bacteroidia bacterium]|nr:carboxypeptidase-like regulatory domain-containing protein [Bacteroidia bacterium]
MKLSIPSPCSENWNNMLPNETGRFCNSCQKSVVDFSKFSDEQLLEFFTKKEPAENVCGKFRNDQLNRTVFISKPAPNLYNRWLALAMGFFTMIKVSDAQTEIKRDESGLVMQNKKSQQNIRSTRSSGISGIVIDEETKEPIPYAVIFIDGTENGTMTDFEGKFRFEKVLLIGNQRNKFIIKHTAYKTKEVEFVTANETALIALSRHGILLETVNVESYSVPLIDVTIMGATRTIGREEIMGGVHSTHKSSFKSRMRSFFYKIFHHRKWKEMKRKEENE